MGNEGIRAIWVPSMPMDRAIGELEPTQMMNNHI